MSSGGWGGVISSAYKKFELRCINSYRYIFPEYVASLIHDLRDADMDISVLCAGDNGCLDGKTRIWCNGKKRQIRNAPEVFMTKVYDAKNNIFIEYLAFKKITGRKKVLKVELDTKFDNDWQSEWIYATADHKWLMYDRRWKTTDKLRVGDEILTYDIKHKNKIKFKKVKYIDKKRYVDDWDLEKTYDLVIPNYNNYVLADSGCIVHNSGKSVAAAIIFKCVNPETPFGPEHVVYAEDKHSDFMSKMEALNDSVLVIDELNKFMSHRSFQDKSQNNLIHFIEIARAKRVATISCVNSYFKVDKSFREGKISIVIQMMDRKKSDSDGLGRSCAAVFAAPPIMLSSSRFGLDALADCHSDQEFINLAPWLPSFRGFMFFPDKDEYLSKEEWSAYTEAKMRGIRKSFEMAKAQTLNAEKRDFKDTEEKSEEEEIAEALEKEKKKLKIAEAKAQWKKEKNTVAKPEAVHHDCGCVTDRDTRGMVYFKTKCMFHSNRPDKTNEIQLAHRKLEITEDDEESS